VKLKAYLPFASAGIQGQLAYKWNFLGFFVGEIFFSFVMYYLWKAVYAHTGGGLINGFSMLDMTVYIFVTNITGNLVGTDVAFAVGEEIVDGSISMRMIKPVSYDMSLLVTELGQKAVLLCLILVPVFTGVEILPLGSNRRRHVSLPRFFLYLASAVFQLSHLVLLTTSASAFSPSCSRTSGRQSPEGRHHPVPLRRAHSARVLPRMGRRRAETAPLRVDELHARHDYTGMYSGIQIAQSLALQLVWAAILFGASKRSGTRRSTVSRCRRLT
jgi:ABC-2 type transport system permease protein